MSLGKLQLSRSEFSENFLYLHGSPLSLKYYPFVRAIYDYDPSTTVVLQTGRQVSKSTTIASIIIANAIMLQRNPYNIDTLGSGGVRSLYVTSAVDQAKIFSYSRLGPLIDDSPFIKKYFTNKHLTNNVFNKTLYNKKYMSLPSDIYIRYAMLTAMRLRGITSDIIYFDEAQNMVLDVMDIVRQSSFTSVWGHEYIMGTPLRTEGTLARYWKDSTQNEWVVKCLSCNKYNILLYESIGNNGPICTKCGRVLDPKIGTWVRMNPEAAEKGNIIEGFRISQLHFFGAPWMNWDTKILSKVNDTKTTASTIYNEILGLPYDSGSVNLTEEDIEKCCDSSYINKKVEDPPIRTRASYMGIDWGPSNSDRSFTVVTILQASSKLKPIVRLMKRFTGNEADFAYLHDIITKLAIKWNVKVIGADRGLGEASNAELRRRLSSSTKIYEFMYSETLKEGSRWDPRAKCYIINRTQYLENFFNDIKEQQYILPNFKSIYDPYVKDMTAIVCDYNEIKKRNVYINSEPDDTVHSLIFGKMGMRLGGALSPVILKG